MSKVLISDQYLNDIANAIRNKSGSDATYTPAQMATAILALTIGETNVPIADDCSWGIASENSAYEIPDDTTLFGGN